MSLDTAALAIALKARKIAQALASKASPIAISPPIITGYAAEGKLLTALRGDYSSPPTSFTQRWLKDGVAIAGQTGLTCPVATGEATRSFTFEETPTNAIGTGAANLSAPVIATFAPAIAFANPTVSLPEGNASQSVTITLNVTRNGATGPLIANLTWGGTATPGVDYAVPPATMTIPNGQNSASLTLAIMGDVVVEANETVTVDAVLRDYPFAIASQTITIADDDGTVATLPDTVMPSANFTSGIQNYGYMRGAQPGDVIATSVPGLTITDPATGRSSGIPTDPNGTTYPAGFTVTRGGVPYDIPVTLAALPNFTGSRYLTFGMSFVADSIADPGKSWSDLSALEQGNAARVNVAVGGTMLMDFNRAGTGTYSPNNGRLRFDAVFSSAAQVQNGVQSTGFMAYGFNDAHTNPAVETLFTVENYRATMFECAAQLIYYGYDPKTFTIVNSPWSTDARIASLGSSRARIEAFNAVDEEIAIAFGFRFADVYSFTQDPALIGDGTHWSNAGHRIGGFQLDNAKVINIRAKPQRASWNINGATSAAIGWAAPAPPTGKTITDYTVVYGVEYRKAYANPNTTPFCRYENSATFSDGVGRALTGLAAGQVYRAMVRANFSDGTVSPWAQFPGSLKPRANGANLVLHNSLNFTGVADNTALGATVPSVGTWTTGMVSGQAAPRILGEGIVSASGGGSSLAYGANLARGDGISIKADLQIESNVSGSTSGLIACADASTFMGLIAFYGNGSLQIIKQLPGGGQQMRSKSIGPQLGAHTMEFQVQEFSQRLLFDGEVVIATSFKDTDLTGFTVGTYHGVRCVGSQSATAGQRFKSVTIRAL